MIAPTTYRLLHFPPSTRQSNLQLRFSSPPSSLLSRDTLNTPFFGNEGDEFAANGATLDEFPYAPIPNGDTTYVWPLSGSEGYYSTFYTGEQQMR